MGNRRATVNGELAVGQRTANGVLCDRQVGLDHPQASVQGEREVHCTFDVALHIPGGLVQVDVPGAARIDVADIAREQRVLERRHVVHRLGIKIVHRDSIDAGDVLVLLDVAADDRRKLRRSKAGVVVGDIVLAEAGDLPRAVRDRNARGAGVVVQRDVGSLPADIATSGAGRPDARVGTVAVRVLRVCAVATIHRRVHVEVHIVRRPVALTNAEVELHAAFAEGVVAVRPKHHARGRPVVIAFARNRLQGVSALVRNGRRIGRVRRDRNVGSRSVDVDVVRVGRDAQRIEHAQAASAGDARRERRREAILARQQCGLLVPLLTVGKGELHIALQQAFVGVRIERADFTLEAPAVVVLHFEVVVA